MLNLQERTAAFAQGNDFVVLLKEQFAVRYYFKIEACGQDYSFYVAAVADAWQPLAERVDGRILSTQAAGGWGYILACMPAVTVSAV